MSLTIASLVVAIFFIERFLFFQGQRSPINGNLVRDVLDKLYAGNIQGTQMRCVLRINLP